MSRKLKKYSKEYKLSLLREYYSSGMTKYAFEKEHNQAPATFLNVQQKSYKNIWEIATNMLPLHRPMLQY